MLPKRAFQSATTVIGLYFGVGCGDLLVKPVYGSLSSHSRYASTCEEGRGRTNAAEFYVYASACGYLAQVARAGEKLTKRPGALADAVLFIKATNFAARRARDRGRPLKTDTAQSAYFERAVNVTTLSKALKDAHVDDDVAEMFVSHVEREREALRKQVADFGPAFKVLSIDPMWEAVKQWNEERKALYSREQALVRATQETLDTLATNSAKLTPRAVDKLFALRDEEVGACTARGKGLAVCLGGPAIYPLTVAAIRAATIHAPAKARAELEGLQRITPMLDVYAAIRQAMREARDRETERRERYVAAKLIGASESALQERFGPTEPIDAHDYDTSTYLFESFPEGRPSVTLPPKPGSQELEQLAWDIAKVEQTGDRAKLHFTDHPRQEDVPVSCHRTGRIARIHIGGYIEYEEVCNSVSVTKHDKPAPVVVSSSEAAQLQAGDYVELYVHKVDRRAGLSFAYPNKPNKNGKKAALKRFLSFEADESVEGVKRTRARREH